MYIYNRQNLCIGCLYSNFFSSIHLSDISGCMSVMEGNL